MNRQPIYRKHVFFFYFYLLGKCMDTKWLSDICIVLFGCYIVQAYLMTTKYLGNTWE